MSIRVLIVDDEPLGRERLRMHLKDIVGVSVVAECAGGTSAVKSIVADKPDLVLLDIQMPDLDGFGVVEELRRRRIEVPMVIFVTAYDQHAVRAFEINAVDYLLKPVQVDRLVEAIERARARLARPDPEGWSRSLGELLATARAGGYLQQIEVRTHGRAEYVGVREIAWLKADGNYVEIHTAERTHLIRETLAELEGRLDPGIFLRVSRSALLNLNHVCRIQNAGRRGHEAVLDDGTCVPIRRALDELRRLLRFTA